MKTWVPLGAVPEVIVAWAAVVVAMQQSPIAQATAEQESFFMVLFIMRLLSDVDHY
jgi:hypothetical protein